MLERISFWRGLASTMENWRGLASGNVKETWKDRFELDKTDKIGLKG